MNRLLMVVALASCACPSKSSSGPTVGSGGSNRQAEAPPPSPTGCDAVRAKVQGFYRAEAQAKEPSRVDQAVMDNTDMVMKDCAKAPAKVAGCIAGVATLADLEATCLVQLDDEGTEGDALK